MRPDHHPAALLKAHGQHVLAQALRLASFAAATCPPGSASGAETGRWALQCASAAAVYARPGATALELAVCAGLNYRALVCCLFMTPAAQQVRHGWPRRCRVTGRRTLTWWPAC